MATNNSWNSQDPAQVAKGGTGVASTTAYAVICGGTTTTSALQSIASVGTSGQVLTSNGASSLPTFQDAGGGGSGSIIQKVVTTDQTATDITTVIPVDSTIPQNTEGTEVITVTITPTDSSNYIELFYKSDMTRNDSGNGGLTGAIFVDSTADAIHSEGCPWHYNGSNLYVGPIVMFYRFLAGSTSARTYKIRMGNQLAGYHIIVNTDYLGGTNNQYFIATEVTP